MLPELMSINAQKITLFIIFMITSTITFPRYVKAQNKPTSRNRIFPTHQSSQENRPIHRNHPYGGTLMWGVRQKPTIINPILTTRTISLNLMNIIFDHLIRINSKAKLNPAWLKAGKHLKTR